MKSAMAQGICVAFVVALGTVAFAQGTAQPQQSTATTQSPTTAASEQVTITGCVQKEADYRAANNLGKGGVVGTTVGVDNEYVLINATVVPAASAAVGTSGSPARTESAAAPAVAFELSGEHEGHVGAFVGKRVEIVGKMKPAEMGAGGATGGVTAGNPPAGVDVASKDLKLREIDVISVKEATGTCPTK